MVILISCCRGDHTFLQILGFRSNQILQRPSLCGARVQEAEIRGDLVELPDLLSHRQLQSPAAMIAQSVIFADHTPTTEPPRRELGFSAATSPLFL